MKSFIFIVGTLLLALAMSSCKQAREVKEVLKGGTFSGGSASDVKLANQARHDMCCPGITIAESTDKKGTVHGCGEIATYEFTNDKWAQASIKPYADHGTAADKAADCSKL